MECSINLWSLGLRDLDLSLPHYGANLYGIALPPKKTFEYLLVST